MNLDDMKADWKESCEKIPEKSIESLTREVVEHATKFESTIVRRDWIEAGAALFVVSFFSIAVFSANWPLLVNVGVGFIIVAAIVAIAIMFCVRLSDSPPDPDLPIDEFSKAELSRVQRQISLLSNVTWWYSLPMMVGVSIFFYGVVDSVPLLAPFPKYGFLAGTNACLLAVIFILYRSNRRAVVNNLIPLRDQIEDCLQAVASETPKG